MSSGSCAKCDAPCSPNPAPAYVGPPAAAIGRIDAKWSARPHRYRAGDEHDGHHHVIEHITFLEIGRIRVDRRDGTEAREYDAPMWIHMPQHVWHKITAITDAKWWCVFYDSRPACQDAPFDAELP